MASPTTGNEDIYGEDLGEPPPPGGDLTEDARLRSQAAEEKRCDEESMKVEPPKHSPSMMSPTSAPGSNLAYMAQKPPPMPFSSVTGAQQMAPHQQMGMPMQRIPLSTQTTPLLPTPSPMQTTAVLPMMPPQHAGPIQPLMSAQPPTHIPPPGFPRAMPPPRFQGPPSIPPPGARPMVPPGPRPLPPMGYSGYYFDLKSVKSLIIT